MRQKGFTFYATQTIDTEYHLEFDDILNLIDELSDTEIEQLRIVLSEHVDDNIPDTHESLYDELKNRLMTAALKKYDLDELQNRLDIKYY